MLRLAIDTHIITSHFALPLLIKNEGGLVVEMTDGTAEYNDVNYRLSLFYDLAKTSVIRMAWAQAQELRPYGCAAVALTPGWMRSEIMLDTFGVGEWNGHSLSSGELAKVYSFTDLDGSHPDAWRYLTEVQDAGRPADATGYR